VSRLQESVSVLLPYLDHSLAGGIHSPEVKAKPAAPAVLRRKLRRSTPSALCVWNRWKC
jgi:hypothetical protein